MEGVPIEDTMLSDMCPDIESAFCFPHKYRTINGECNNVKNPTWGITGAAYLRILQPTYQDGRSTRHPVNVHFSLCVVVVVWWWCGAIGWLRLHLVMSGLGFRLHLRPALTLGGSSVHSRPHQCTAVYGLRRNAISDSDRTAEKLTRLS